MGDVTIDQAVIFYPRKRIRNELGDVFHVLKNNDSSFMGFGEAYITTVRGGAVKGWKMHFTMHMNIAVIHGSVRFYVKENSQSKSQIFLLNAANYGCLSIKPRTWVAFEGLSSERNIILNIASEPHDPNESISIPITDLPLT